MGNRRFHSIQTRLALAFSVLFLAGILILAFFIKFAADYSEYNRLAGETFTQTRQFYLVKQELQHLQTVLSEYTLTTDPDWLDEYNSSYSLLDQYLTHAIQTMPENKAALTGLKTALANLRPLSDQVIAAAEAAGNLEEQTDAPEEQINDAWTKVDELNSQVVAQSEAITAQIDTLIDTQNAHLADVQAQVSTFANTGPLLVGVAVSIFLVLLAILVWLVNRQVSAPLKRMTAGLPAILDGSFEAGQLVGLAERQDEIGFLAREYLRMAAALSERHAALQQQAEELRQRIRP